MTNPPAARTFVRRLAVGALALAAGVAAWALTPRLGGDRHILTLSFDDANAQGPSETPAEQPRPSRRQQAPAATAAAPALSAADQADVARAERYLNDVQTLQARFAQVGASGRTLPGTLSLRRPGRMRFEYDPPVKLLIVADGSQVTMADFSDGTFSQWPLGWTSASFLAAEKVVLSGDLTVTGVTRAAGELRLTMIQTSRPQEGRVEIAFADRPLMLKGWTTWDSKGTRVDVTLNALKTGMPLANDLFRFDEHALKRAKEQR